MLESGLFFTLGFLVAILLILMIAPAIWRRAVSLTRKTIESSIPLTVSEIQADKDQLRAEFAMNTRRLEVNLEDTKEQSAEQLIEINRRRDEMLAMEADRSEKLIRITELESQAAERESRLNLTEGQLKQTSQTMSSIQGKLEEKSTALDDLDHKYRDAVDDFDGQKIEMVARETRLDTIQDEASQTREKLKSKSSEHKELLAETKTLNTALSKETKRNGELEEKLAKLQSLQADMEGRLERRDNDLAKLREKSGADGDRMAGLEKQLNKTQSEKSKLDSNPTEELDDLRKALERAEKERNRLKAELSTLKLSGKGKSSESSENALMRERIKDLAAKVTAHTATVEGPGSPVNKALGSKPKRKPTKGHSKGNTKKKSDTDAARSLAGRIRALQAASE